MRHEINMKCMCFGHIQIPYSLHMLCNMYFMFLYPASPPLPPYPFMDPPMVEVRGDARTGYEASRAHGLSGLACAGDLVVVVVVVARPGQVLMACL